ncbi:MAG TPA: hypothetical protein VF240_17135 [Pyrinomonadaceae bacterium]
MPKAKRVVSLAEREKEKWEREAGLYAEAMMKDSPSAEARAYYDAQLDADPEEWRRHGDLTAEALDLAFEKFWLGYVTKESVRRGAELLKQELGYAEALPAERILIEHAVLCHVRLGMIEHLYSRNTSGSYTVSLAEHYEKRLTLAQRRFTRSVVTLARVRGLLARADAARESARRASSARSLAVLKQMAG